MPLPDTETRPIFGLGEMVLYGDGVCRVLGYECFMPGTMWFYLLGAKVGKTKMQWHKRVPEIDLRKPCQDNIVELKL